MAFHLVLNRKFLIGGNSINHDNHRRTSHPVFAILKEKLLSLLPIRVAEGMSVPLTTVPTLKLDTGVVGHLRWSLSARRVG